MSQQKKALVIYGPTAIGKTSLGIKLAQGFKGEIISADSRQVYQEMDLGTGKEVQENSKLQVSEIKPVSLASEQISKLGFQVGYYLVDGVKIWLLDIIRPDQEFSSYQWSKLARLVILDVWRRGKLPIIVGGSAFYIKTLLDGLDTEGIGPNWKLREKLEQMSLERLQGKLKLARPEKWRSLNDSDRKNPRRLIRAIEIGRKQLAKPVAFWGGTEILAVRMTASLDFLRKRIKERVKRRLEKGLVKEIKKLIGRGYSWSDPGMNTLAYKEFRPFFEKGASFDDACEKWLIDEIHYAKRQMLWFRDDRRFVAVDVERRNWYSQIHKKIKRWYDG